ncbi:carbohydrate ABC transporter permease [Cohnella sp. 56]|uniref:carbohydrate ABC transporter permease n=1 Tax=Cohnella sp. 56 TaxID=3113722 RepID=UPI0030E7DD3B
MARTRSKQGRSDQWWGYLFITPQILGLLAFTLFPVVTSLYLCFVHWDFTSPAQAAGLDNFETIFHEELFYKGIVNTFLIAIGVVPMTVLLSLALALLTNGKMRGLAIYKAALFLPMVTSSAAVILVWYWIYAPDIGLLNYFLGKLGVKGPDWLTEPFWARAAIVLMLTWQGMGYYYIIFLAGLKGIPRDYYEAAEIDGANPLQRFLRITVPLLSPTTFFIVVTMLISCFNAFQEPFILTKGGPNFSTYNIVMYVYDLAFRYFRMGEAAVVSVVMVAIIGLITFIQFRLSRRWVTYLD